MVNEHVKANTHFFFFWKYLESVVQKQKRLLQAQQRDIKYLERKEVETEKKEAEKRKLQATSIAKLASKITHNKRVKVRRKTYSRGFFYHHLIITLCSLSTIKASGTEKKNKKVRPNKVVFGWVHVAESPLKLLILYHWLIPPTFILRQPMQARDPLKRRSNQGYAVCIQNNVSILYNDIQTLNLLH